MKAESFDDIYETITDADALVLMTEWNEYRGLDFERLRQQMKGTVFVDLRNVYEPVAMRNNGFTCTCIGRQVPQPE